MSLEQLLVTQVTKNGMKKIHLSEILNGKVVVKLMRRFGCPLCRMEAKALSSYKPIFDKYNVKLIGIGFDINGYKEFEQGNYWDGELYLDQEKKVYEYFNLKRVTLFNAIFAFTSPTTLNSLKQAKEMGVGGNYTKGDGFQLGATLLFDNQELIYKFEQVTGSDYPDIKKMIELIGGNSNVIENTISPHFPVYHDNKL